MTFQNEMVKMFESFSKKLNVIYDYDCDYYSIDHLNKTNVKEISKEINELIKKYDRVCMNTISSNSITIRDMTSLQ